VFLQPDSKNFHVQYPDVNRHWSPNSEDYAGGDCLLTAINRGWEIGNEVVKEEHWHAGVRMVAVYRFRLRRGDQEIVMPVIENPYVTRLLYMSPFEVTEAKEAGDKSKQRAS
jgi:hypothetical protein